MQFSANRRFRNGVSFGGNYTLTLERQGQHRSDAQPVRLDHNADGSYVVRADQAAFNDLMSNPGLQRHIVKANFVWDLPDMQGATGREADRGGHRQRLAVVRDLHRRLGRAV